MSSYLIVRVCAAVALVVLPPLAAAPDPDRDFAGVWILDEKQSDVRALPASPASLLTITQQDEFIRCTESSEHGNSSATWVYRTDGEPARFQVGASRMSSMTKWEGAALITNTIVSPQNYNVNDRWRLSRDHNVLTIHRQILQPSGQTDAVLIYRNRDAKPVNQPESSLSTDHTAPAPEELTVPAGTKILLALINSLNTKLSAEGDRVYLQTSFPIVISGHIIIPKGSYVAGTVTEVKRPGKVRGKGEIYLRFDSLTLPNGITRDFRARLGGSDTGDFDREEGKIRGEGDKGGDARRTAETTAAGAGVGSVAGAAAGHAGMGAGIGAAGGAAVGLASVLLSRGPELILPKGTAFEMVLDRGLKYKSSELAQQLR